MSQCLVLKNSCTFCFIFPIRFFVVEDHILHATQGLVTRPFTDELWNMALSKIIAVLRTHSVGIHTQTYLQAEFFVLLILVTILTSKIPIPFIWVCLLDALVTILRAPAQKVE